MTQQQPQGQGAEGGPVLTVPPPMRNSPMELVRGPLTEQVMNRTRSRAGGSSQAAKEQKKGWSSTLL